MDRKSARTKDHDEVGVGGIRYGAENAARRTMAPKTTAGTNIDAASEAFVAFGFLERFECEEEGITV